ncbi:hypothetical protein [Pontibacter amylolyticus]|uniref:hypothetical protein n=1 Tax=Pontibacter amylolyticus TaxID=1424080 RepID=UPI001665266F|nr:hypothetical protein [Pontibacter amylolyticus]
MIRLIVCFLLLLSLPVYGQVENRWQPDSVYINRNIKKIFVYLNSPKDLSEVVECDKDGNKVRVVKYSASYNRKTRRSKTVEQISHYLYDSLKRPTQVIDTIFHFSNSVSVNNTYLSYNSSGLLASSKYYKGSFQKPYSVTNYYYSPFKSTTVRTNDSLTFYQKSKEYDRDFYVKRFYGFYLEQKLKSGLAIHEGDTTRFQFSDYSDLQRFEDDKIIENKFDAAGRLISSDIRSVFMNDRVNEYKLVYSYDTNGLLKSIRGYIPKFYKYEFHE